MVYGTAADIDKLRAGMSKEEVVKTLGTPDDTAMDADKDQETLTYKKMRGVISWLPKLYDVTLRTGKVVKWGERR